MEQLPFIERNFHIMNDDRFIMEKISLPIEIQDGEDIHAAINRTRETIVQNFKAAYPKVYTHLNFDETIHVNKIETPFATIDIPSSKVFTHFEKEPTPNYNSAKVTEPTPTKIISLDKQTIEEQIQAYTDAEQLEKDWFNTVKGSKKYKTVYDAKILELQSLKTT